MVAHHDASLSRRDVRMVSVGVTSKDLRERVCPPPLQHSLLDSKALSHNKCHICHQNDSNVQSNNLNIFNNELKAQASIDHFKQTLRPTNQ